MTRFQTDLLDLRLGDCMDLMRDTPDGFYDLAIVDPPYGATCKLSGGKAAKDGYADYWDKVSAKGNWNMAPLADYFAEVARVSKHQIIWGANHYPGSLSPSSGWIFWDKGQRDFSFSGGELAYSSFPIKLKVFDYARALLHQEGRIHPTQKPVALYNWLLANYAKPGQRILDTHLGSGSIAIACHYFGAHLTATEIDPDYFAAAVERIQRETQQIELFPPAPQHPTHEEIPLL
jgi:site-specific DNA-methyltransferase (adenine-specific)